MSGKLFDLYYHKQINADLRNRGKVPDAAAPRRFPSFGGGGDLPKHTIVESVTESSVSSYGAVWDETMRYMYDRRSKLIDLPRSSPARLQTDAIIGLLEKYRAVATDTEETVHAKVEGLNAELESMFAAEAPSDFKEYMTTVVSSLRDVALSVQPGGEPGEGGMGGGGGAPGGGEDGLGGEGGDGEGEDGEPSAEEPEPEENEIDKIAAEILPGGAEPTVPEATPRGRK